MSSGRGKRSVDGAADGGSGKEEGGAAAGGTGVKAWGGYPKVEVLYEKDDVGQWFTCKVPAVAIQSRPPCVVEGSSK